MSSEWFYFEPTYIVVYSSPCTLSSKKGKNLMGHLGVWIRDGTIPAHSIPIPIPLTVVRFRFRFGIIPSQVWMVHFYLWSWSPLVTSSIMTPYFYTSNSKFITHFNSWESDIANLTLCQECDKLHITLSQKNFWNFFQKCLFWPKMSKNVKKIVGVRVRYFAWQNSPKTKKNAQKQVFDRERMCD